MYEDDTTDAEGGLAVKIEDDEDSIMDTGLYHEVQKPEVNESYLNVSCMLKIGDRYVRGKVIGRKRDADENTIGRKNNNPILNTREYRVEFDDGRVSELTANVIEESMYAACDYYGNEYLMMDLILDYRNSDKVVSVFIHNVVHRGQSFNWQSTVGWQICVQWRYGFTSWQSLKDLKELYPVEISEYAVAQEINHEPVFN